MEYRNRFQQLELGHVMLAKRLLELQKEYALHENTMALSSTLGLTVERTEEQIVSEYNEALLQLLAQHLEPESDRGNPPV